MKKIIYIIAIALFILQGCVYESHYGQDGQSFLKINWVDEEPSYVDAGGAIPANFYWDTYYRTYPGLYTVDFEYEEYTRFGKVIYPFQVDIEIFNNQGEAGGNDGKDVYFELVLYPDGYIDFTHQEDYKSGVVSDSLSIKDVTVKTEIGKKEVIKNGKRMVCTYYQLPSRK